MRDVYYAVQLEKDGAIINCQTPKEVYNLLIKKKLISVLRYNDKKTGRAYTKAAANQDLTVAEQEQTPVFIKTVLSDEGAFVKDEAFWIENYMFDEFYNPERLPYIEATIKRNDENY